MKRAARGEPVVNPAPQMGPGGAGGEINRKHITRNRAEEFSRPNQGKGTSGSKRRVKGITN